MQLFAASIASAAETFLHPGYGATSPAPLGEMSAGPSFDSLRLQLDLVDAFRLEGEKVAASAAAGPSGEWSGLLPWIALAGLFAVLALCAASGRHRLALARAPAVALLALLAALGSLAWRAGDPPTGPTPASAVRYADPELATRGLLHGIIAPAFWSAHPGRIKPSELLDTIKPHVALPTTDPTPGMKHALATYTLDGWGRPFQVHGGWSVGFRVVSAGKDGVFKTKDDRVAIARQPQGEFYNDIPDQYYLRKHEGKVRLLFRIGKQLEAHDAASARKLTGGALFDAASLGQLDRQAKEQGGTGPGARLRRIFAGVARGKKHEPLVLLVTKQT